MKRRRCPKLRKSTMLRGQDFVGNARKIERKRCDGGMRRQRIANARSHCGVRTATARRSS
eukprot:1526222-Pyramimonas_sp.AAC.1